MRNIYKKLTEEDKSSRRFACWAINHGGFSKYKRQNRRLARRKLKKNLKDELL